MRPRGRRRIDLSQAAVSHLGNELKLSWRQVANSLGTSVRKVRRVYTEIPSPVLSAEIRAVAVTAPAVPVMQGNPKKNRRGRPYADLNAAEIVRLREELGMSWRQIGKKLNARASTARRAYVRTQTTSRCAAILSTPWQKSATAKLLGELDESTKIAVGIQVNSSGGGWDYDRMDINDLVLLESLWQKWGKK